MPWMIHRDMASSDEWYNNSSFVVNIQLEFIPTKAFYLSNIIVVSLKDCAKNIEFTRISLPYAFKMLQNKLEVTLSGFLVRLLT